MKLQISPARMEVHLMKTGTTSISSIHLRVSVRGRKSAEQVIRIGIVELVNNVCFSISCCRPLVVFSMPKGCSSVALFPDRWTLWFLLKTCDGYTSTVASTPWRQSHISSDQRHGSPIAQDFPKTLISKLKIRDRQLFDSQRVWRTRCHQGCAPLLADEPDIKKILTRHEYKTLIIFWSLGAVGYSREVEWILE